MFESRVTLLVGHFGSGKTEIALNGALDLVASGQQVTLADLDVVKPYFRTRSARAMLDEAGIDLIIPRGEHVHADLPIIVPQIRSILSEKGRKVIMDVGGDETGARVLGSLSDVMPTTDTECLVVLNFRRPSTRNVDQAVKMVGKIEAVSRVGVTGLVSNTHLMKETTPEVVLEGFGYAEETGRRLGIPLAAVTVDEAAKDGLSQKDFSCPLVFMRRIVMPPFMLPKQQRTTGPLFVPN